MLLKSLLTTLILKQLNQIHAQLIIRPKPQILNPLLGVLANSSRPRNALLLYNLMLYYPFSHNHYTFTLTLKACSLLHAHTKGLEVHGHVIKSGHYADIFIQNCLLHFYIVEHDVGSALKIFEFIPSPDVVSWTSIISGLSKCGFEAEAIRKFSLMDVKPNSATLVSALTACSFLKAMTLGKAIHAYGMKGMVDNNIIFDNAMLDLYARCGSLVNAEHLFANMMERDVVSWTTMVGAYAQRGRSEEAVDLFKKMVLEGEAVPNEVTVVTVLSACASIGALSLGQWVHSYIKRRSDLVVEGIIGNALLNMFAKCGDMNMAIQIFKMLEHKDVISWGTLICGLAMNGHGKHTVQLFSRMLIHGVPPDDVTFIGLLSACSHSGLVNKGFMFFKAMRDYYGIMPQMQHFCCMLDMYGRAGLFEEAEAFLKGMPVEAKRPVWVALLQACKIHGNEEMLDWIRRNLLNDENVGDGALALLSNHYASTERWDDANKVRGRMRRIGLKKMTGRSWIELDARNDTLDLDLCGA
ncbi:pentatricopeptide repeat-containing protein At1g08070, chloroplastic-like [Neltuma alba]|uniref:pentatricopeptide repeat-containing protein At1g08070, chloroplastic-like n=1 Tax=Neltuma alba TaxID=207710 RepID=UPI0010A38FE7|nr:pentatricopeptide repeat-containing protein At1g08070, chloroplastic-like [Prosopis alba]XP_028764349.1 pentatricopeptide repeat-containing protein At1g08070, chloroplastic-like [Prosopis alba]XP_028764350.1 pentatricopeptide repeat-containing protein At1g08070, chloroplastic-like [Prosopis alba]